MELVPGAVVVLKSGGQLMTVVKVTGEEAECIWIGEEGDFFREKIPTIALDVIDLEEHKKADEEEEEEEEEEDEEK